MSKVDFEQINDIEELAKHLNAQQLAFCQHYCESWSAAKAARAANYSESTVGQIGHNLLKHPPVARYIDLAIEQIRKDNRQRAEILTQYLLEALYLDISDIFEVTGTGKAARLVLKKGKEIPPSLGKFITQVSSGSKGNTYKLFSKETAADMLAKKIGFYKADNEQKKLDSVQVYLPDNLRDQQEITE